MKDFGPERFTYTVSRSEDGTAPEITLGEGDSAATESFTLYDGTEAMVFSVADANGNETSYVVKILEYDNTNIDVYNTYSMTAVEASSEPVSYTHLDVYKRQGCKRADGTGDNQRFRRQIPAQ